MRKYLLILFVSFIAFSGISAQKEVFFNTTKTNDIKVASLQGIETRISIQPDGYGSGSLSLPEFINPAIYIGYFNEKRIADYWTINSTIGLQNIDTKSPDWHLQEDSINGDYLFGNSMKNTYAMMLEVGIEPRWYFNFKNRYQNGHAKLNSGCFFSLPVSYNTLLINTYKWPESENSYHTNFKNYGSLNTLLLFGYRQAITKNWFLEGNLTTIGYGCNFYKYTTGFYVYPNFVVNPMINLKASYTFK